MSTRGLSAAQNAALAADTIRPAMLFEGQFATGWVRLWSGLGNFVWGGNTYIGAGEFLSCSTVDEGEGVASRGVQVTLSASASLVSAALGSARQGMPGRVYLALFDAAGALVDQPVLLFAGRMDVPTFARSGDRATITLAYEDELVDLERARIRRYTPEDQALTDPADRGFDFVTALQDVSVVWGSR
jgi:hypothetical protein